MKAEEKKQQNHFENDTQEERNDFFLNLQQQNLNTELGIANKELNDLKLRNGQADTIVKENKILKENEKEF